MWKEYIEKLISEQQVVKITTKDSNFYTGTIKEFHPCHDASKDTGCILLIDKFGEEVLLDLDFVQRIVPFKDKFRGEKNGG